MERAALNGRGEDVVDTVFEPEMNEVNVGLFDGVFSRNGVN